MNETKIEWCDKTINPVIGCDHGCPYCYARKLAKRIAMMQAGIYLKRMDIQYKHLDLKDRMDLYRSTPVWCEDCYTFTPHEHLDRLHELDPQQKGKRIFIDSMWDWNCTGNKNSWMGDIIAKMVECQNHIFIILSKNPRGYQRFDIPENAWIGTSITGLEKSNRKIETLLELPNNNLKFLSIEPLHSRVNYNFNQGKKLDWLIIGAETGNRKNKIIPQKEWIDRIIEQAEEAEIPIFIKDSVNKYLGTNYQYQQYPERGV